MMKIVMRKVYLRPTRSPRRPKKIAPKGLTKNPAANARSAKINCPDSVKPEKKWEPIMAASDP
jgi:hypothetical protein